MKNDREINQNNLITKEVDFDGATLMAVQDTNTEKIFVGVKWICDGLGLSQGQIKSERQKLQTDLVLSKGGRNFVLPTKGGKQEVLCIDVKLLPLWLAKISITPNMQKTNPELVDNLIKYQLKAADVLAKAFLNKPNIPQEFMDKIPKTYGDALILCGEVMNENDTLQKNIKLLENENKQILPKAVSWELFTETDGLYSIRAFAQMANIGLGQNKFYNLMRDMKLISKKSTLPYQQFIDMGILRTKMVMCPDGNQREQCFITTKGMDYVLGKLYKSDGINLKKLNEAKENLLKSVADKN